jgi:hypothetical protein
MAGMTRRDIGFLMIGLGVGLSFFIAFSVALLKTVHSMGLIVAYSWERVMLLVPFSLVVAGFVLIFYKRKPVG